MSKERNIKRAENINNTPSQRDNLLVRNLFDQEFVLLIGSEAIFEKEYDKTQGTGDSMFWLYNAYADVYGIPLDKRPRSDHEWQIQLNYFSNFSLIKYDLQSNSKHVLDGLWGQINEDDPYWFRQKCRSLFSEQPTNHFEDSLEALLKTKKFRIIFTTCIDDLLESMLREIWGDKLEVYNFIDAEDVKKFIDTAKKRSDNKMLETKPCLVYLFGKIGAIKNTRALPFVFSEDDALDAIAQYIRGSNGLIDVANKFLIEHPIMSIGCHFDDWRFRFFWYALNGMSQRERDLSFSKGTVAYPVSEPDSLKWYLTNSEVQVEPDSREFMKRLVRLLSSEESIRFILDERIKDGKGIFISYASEEFLNAYNLFKDLRKEGFKVWIDHEDLREGEPYEKRIQDAIKQCGVFMPILGTQAKRDLEANNLGRYYMGEWSFAHNEHIKFMPVIYGDYHERADYHQRFREISGFNEATDPHIKTINEKDRIFKDLREYLLNQ